VLPIATAASAAADYNPGGEGKASRLSGITLITAREIYDRMVQPAMHSSYSSAHSVTQSSKSIPSVDRKHAA
jgi:hypothetical protein